MSEPEAAPRPRLSGNARAALLVLVASAFFAAMGALAKAANGVPDAPVIPPIQIAACRFLFGLLSLLPVLWFTGQLSYASEIKRFHAARVCCGVGGVACMFAALVYVPLADVTAISFSGPLFTLLFAGLFLRELVGRRRWLAALIGFLGVLLIVRPGVGTFQPAALIAVLAAVLIGAEMTIIRQLAKSDPAASILLYSNTGGAILALALAAPFWVWPSPAQWLPLVAVGGSTVFGQLLFARASALGEASFVAPFSYAAILFATLYGLTFFDETPGWPLLGGTVLLLVSGLAMQRTARA